MTSPATTSFTDLALSAPILKVLEEIGYETPSPIQAASIPKILGGSDIIGQAQTGTGKTAAFALPFLTKLDLSIKDPQILVLAPTRELAIQVAEAFQTYARHLKGFHVLPIYGGQSMSTQLRQLKRGAHVVVGTPGRVMDHLRRDTLKLDCLTSLILDEADEMLKMGFIEDVEWILEKTPKDRQIALFSATMPPVIRKIANRHLNNPEEIKIKSKTSTVETITQHFWQVTGLHKLDALTRILEVEDFDAMIIFVRTKNATVELAEKLEARGYSSAALNGDMNQALREKTIDRLKKGSLDIVIATDVAARGLDVERISHVMNYDIPYDTETYVHRIGRTGRAGRKGTAILFISPREKRMLRSIEKATNQPITAMKMPTREDVTYRRIELFKEQLSHTLESEDLSFFTELVENYQNEKNVAPNEIAAAFAYLAQKERPLVIEEAPVRAERSRSGRDERPSRGGRDNDRGEERPKRKRRNQSDENMISYRIDVGRTHGVQPKNIVGAIANEAGVESQHIGAIDIRENFSLVDLPEGMPDEIFRHLKNVHVCNQKLNIAVDTGGKGGDKKPSTRRRKPDSRKQSNNE